MPLLNDSLDDPAMLFLFALKNMELFHSVAN
jgi:hypothetical protein